MVCGCLSSVSCTCFDREVRAAYPDGNPKTAVGATKVPLWLVPPSAEHYLAEAFADGARKYGPFNWRDQKVSASVYVSAMRRHIAAWLDGEDLSPDAGVEHLAHVMACCAIVLDAKSVGMLNDDRPSMGATPRLQSEFGRRQEQNRSTSPASTGTNLYPNPVNQRDEE